MAELGNTTWMYSTNAELVNTSWMIQADKISTPEHFYICIASKKILFIVGFRVVLLGVGTGDGHAVD